MATENTNEEQIMNNFNDKTADIFIGKIMNDELIQMQDVRKLVDFKIDCETIQ